MRRRFGGGQIKTRCRGKALHRNIRASKPWKRKTVLIRSKF
jgi:hypothetical protein